MIAVLPFRGEFGLKLRYHVPAVAALPRPVAVCVEEGEEALFPGTEHMIVKRKDDDFRRRDLTAKDDAVFLDQCRDELEVRYPGCRILTVDRSRNWAEKRFVPTPFVDYGLSADVVIGPRERTYQPSKNWGHWRELAGRLRGAGFRVMAAGVADSSDTSVGQVCPVTWTWPRPLDATLGLIQRAKLVVSTDAGLAHLAVLCGTPLLMISHAEGIVAPGEDRPGHSWWPIRLEEYYHAANHTGSRIDVVHHAWFDVQVTVDAVLERLGRVAVA